MAVNGGRGVVGEQANNHKGTDWSQAVAIERLLSRVRRELDAEVNERAAAFDGWADSVYRKVLEKYRLEQQRGTWVQRVRRWLTTAAAAMWNSRAVRLLVP
jgi:hypothetical protein